MCTLLGDPFPSIREVGGHVRAGGILVKLSLMNFNGQVCSFMPDGVLLNERSTFVEFLSPHKRNNKQITKRNLDQTTKKKGAMRSKINNRIYV